MDQAAAMQGPPVMQSLVPQAGWGPLIQSVRIILRLRLRCSWESPLSLH